MTQARCPACSSPLIGADDGFCEECGHRQTPPCVGCGEGVISDGYCNACGLLQPTGRDRQEKECGDAFAVTDKGLRHARNEDAMFVATAGDHVTAVVCDGVSMSPHPEDASQAAVDTAGAVLAEELANGRDPADASLAAVRKAFDVVVDLAESPTYAPACTFVSAVIGRDEVTVCWVGDSRAYWLAGADSRQLTTDDSCEQNGGHALVHWLGADAESLDAKVTVLRPERSGLVLLCSDGLWNYVPAPTELDAIVTAETTPTDAGRALVRRALDGGGRDNITVILGPFGETHG